MSLRPQTTSVGHLDPRELVAEAVGGQRLQRGHEARRAGAAGELVGQLRRELLRVAHDQLQPDAAHPRPRDHGAPARAQPRRRPGPDARPDQQRLARGSPRSTARRRSRAPAARPASRTRAPARRPRSRPSSCRPTAAASTPSSSAARRGSARSPGSRSPRAASATRRSRQVGRDHPVGAHERGDVEQPVLPGAAEPVHEHHRRPSVRARPPVSTTLTSRPSTVTRRVIDGQSTDIQVESSPSA